MEIAPFSCTPRVQEVHTKAEVVHISPGLLGLGVLFNCDVWEMYCKICLILESPQFGDVCASRAESPVCVLHVYTYREACVLHIRTSRKPLLYSRYNTTH